MGIVDMETQFQKVASKDLAKSEGENAELRKQQYQEVGNAFGALSEIIGQQTAAGKALAVAQATINTYQGATEVLRAKSTLPEPIATISKIINVAAVIASGISAVKKIVSVQVPKGGGSAAGGGSTAALSSIQAPIRPEAQTTMLNQASINQIGNAAAPRAYVLESEGSSAQERITRINRAARIN